MNPEHKGFNVAPDRNVEILQQMSVAAAMHESWVMLKDTQSVLEAGLALTQGRYYSALVFDIAFLNYLWKTLTPNPSPRTGEGS
ncbi:MAG: hypothetical protein ACRC8Y_04670 [Chroococcales cyanobacterium]